MKAIFFFFIACCAVLGNCTVVFKCGSTSEKFDGVTISGCEKPVCQLKKNSVVSIEEKFVSNDDVEKIVTEVKAIIHGVPAPFIGVDGKNACEQIYHKGGQEKAGCPLKKGVEYVYKNEFKIEKYYPNLAIIVHYALEDEKNQQLLTCFEVPAKISS